jgi:RNA polymerase sigma-70 factor (ECF subfamily)
VTDEPPDADSERALDRRLLAAHVAGDPDAFTELVRRHSARLWAVAVRTLADREEAADALQEALVNAYRNAGSYRGDAAVTSWLHRIVVNACVDRMRRAKVRPTVPLPPGDVAGPRDEHAATEARIDVQAALARLPEHQRLAIVLVDLQDLSVAEAAEVLGVAEGTVKSRCARGRATLAELLRPGNPPAAPDVAGHGTPEPPASPHRPATAASGDARGPGEPT